MAESEPSPKRGPSAKAVLGSGLPLELRAYGHLTTAITPGWVEPDLAFPCLDESGNTKQRSIDFVASVHVDGDPGVLDFGVQVYFVVECKYQPPAETALLFMPDLFRTTGGVFDDWRPALWRERPVRRPWPHGIDSNADASSLRHGAREASDPIGGPVCVKADVFRTGEKDSGAPPVLATALHQLRDALHEVAKVRFRRFVGWDPPKAVVFVPVLVTNAEMHVLRADAAETILGLSREERIDLKDIARPTRRALLRCPPGTGMVAANWNRFREEYGDALERFASGVPFYKQRGQDTEFHYRNFFESTPGSVAVVHVDELPAFLPEVVKWARQIEFEEPDPGPSKTKRGRRKE